MEGELKNLRDFKEQQLHANDVFKKGIRNLDRVTENLADKLEGIRSDLSALKNAMNELKDSVGKNNEETIGMRSFKDEQLHKNDIVTKDFTNLARLINDKVDEIKKDLSPLKNAVESVQNSCDKNEIEMAKLWLNLNDQTSSLKNLKEMVEELKTTADKINEETTKLWTNVNEKASKDAVIKLDKTFSTGEYIWVIENYSEKQNLEELFSEEFYIRPNGYRMQLSLYPNGYGNGKNTHISISARFVFGDYDNILEWPCKETFSISLFDQNNDRSKDFHGNIAYGVGIKGCPKSYDKPIIDEYNNDCGFPKFISISDFSKGNYIKDDTVLVKLTMSSK